MQSIEDAVTLLSSGQPVAFPTETVYGLGADAWNTDAIQTVFTLKGRPSDNPLIVHVANREQMLTFVQTIPEYAQLLMDAFWPGPLTIVLPKKAIVPDIITAGLSTVAIRQPNHPLALTLIQRSGPLVAPSANRSGKPSPTKAEHVSDDFGSQVSVIDGGPTRIGLESSVVDLTMSVPVLLRPGSIGKAEIEGVLGMKINESSTHKDNGTPKSPGVKYSHYKPLAEVRWLREGEPYSPHALYLFLSRSVFGTHPNCVEYNQDFDCLARELYDRFRQADRLAYTSVVIESFPDSTPLPITQALLNRIQKAQSE
ncbi:MAG: L-threonylcarbamoyladenylate synthase [Bacteroidota bacterium]